MISFSISQVVNYITYWPLDQRIGVVVPQNLNDLSLEHPEHPEHPEHLAALWEEIGIDLMQAVHQYHLEEHCFQAEYLDHLLLHLLTSVIHL